tara:strand:+ start:162 stop:995 length:834 start_codon:yes stop_codon:yes gene_type:complete
MMRTTDRSPLRYPGGKTKAITQLQDWVPAFTEYREPFLGGGSMAINVAKHMPGKSVWVNDLYVPLYNFWIQLRDNAEELSERLFKLKTDLNKQTEECRKVFNQFANEIDDATGVDQAVMFWMMNKCSYSGLTQNSSFSPTASNSNFSLRGTEMLLEYSKLIQNWKITNVDYSELLQTPGQDVFVFLDPPYDIKDFLYGKDREMHRNFDHHVFADHVDGCLHKFMITYNVNDWLEERYKNYYQRYWKLQYGMVHRQNNKKTELLVTNYNCGSPLEALF